MGKNTNGYAKTWLTFVIFWLDIVRYGSSSCHNFAPSFNKQIIDDEPKTISFSIFSVLLIDCKSSKPRFFSQNEYFILGLLP